MSRSGSSKISRGVVQLFKFTIYSFKFCMIYTGYTGSAMSKSLMGGVIDVVKVNGPAPSGSTAEKRLFQISFCLPGMQLCNWGLNARKLVFGGLRTTKAQTSLRIRAV